MSGGLKVLNAAQRDAFLDRIDRINEGGPNTNGQVYAGPADTDGPRVKPSRRRGRRKSGKGLKSLLVLPVALMLGATAMLLGKLASFHIFLSPSALQPGFAATPIPTTAAIGLMVIFTMVFALTFRIAKGPGRLALLVGAAAFFAGQGAVIAQAPELFSALFSDTYVSGLIGATLSPGEA